MKGFTQSRSSFKEKVASGETERFALMYTLENERLELENHPFAKGKSSEPSLHLLCVRAVNFQGKLYHYIPSPWTSSKSFEKHVLPTNFCKGDRDLLKGWWVHDHVQPIRWGCVQLGVPPPTWPSFILREFFLRTDSPSWTSKFFLADGFVAKKNQGPQLRKSQEVVSWSFESGQIRRGHQSRFPKK